LGNTIWSKLNSKAKTKKNTYEISKKTNIPEEKVKEIMSGDRELPADRVDDFIGVIKEDNKAEKSITMASIRKWVEDTDLRELRKSYGYESQGELAGALGLDSSTVCRMEGKKVDHISDATLQKYYDFLNDELNKKVKKKAKRSKVIVNDSRTKIQVTKNVASEEDRKILRSIKFEDAVKWFENFDLKEYLNDNNLTYRDFVTTLGYNKNSVSLISNLISGKIDVRTTGRTILIKTYAYINGLIGAQNNAPEEEKPQVVESVKEEAFASPEPQDVATKDDYVDSLNSTEGTESTTDDNTYYYHVEGTDISIPYKISSVTFKNGEYVFNEEEDPTKEEEKVTIPMSEYERLKDDLDEAKEEIEKLEKQLERYEKLIDMIER
jgi:transcriptional regulator with XRE-family HTH domain